MFVIVELDNGAKIAINTIYIRHMAADSVSEGYSFIYMNSSKNRYYRVRHTFSNLMDTVGAKYAATHDS